jgi:aspartate-semialdehyde dehydrogenase
MRIAILGASGLVGRTMLGLLQQQAWVSEPPRALTSARSAGQPIPFGDGTVVCEDVGQADLADLDLVLMSAGREASRRWAPVLAERGAWVVDNSSAWRMDPDVALVVPEVNAAETADAPGRIVANPNCSTIQIALPCAVLDELVGLREAHVTTLQAVSGAGQAGTADLAADAAEVAGGERAGAGRAGQVFPRRIAANAIPQIGPLADSGFFEEEEKVHHELRKILARPDLAVTCTATRVPTWNGHAAAVRAVLAREIALADVAAALNAMPGLVAGDSPGDYRTPAEVSGDRRVHVGRVRHEPGRRDVVLFWVVADNLLKGAAWNAVQIAAHLVGEEAT